MNSGTLKSVWSSSFTFQQCLVEKTAFVVLNGIDLILTIVAVDMGLYELNPLMLSIIKLPHLLFSIKLLIPFLFAWMVPGKWLIPADITLLAIVLWDLKELIFFVL